MKCDKCGQSIKNTTAYDKKVACEYGGLIKSREGISSAAAKMGRKGGASKSERKKASSRANGLKGGRPRKTAAPGSERMP